ncbi:HlyD family secretion protein [Hydrogenivirga sp.]
MISLLLTLVLFFGVASFAEECVVQSKEVVRSVYASGYVRSERQLLLRSPVSGHVVGLFADRGDRVRREQLIAVIDSGGLEDKLGAIGERIKLLEERLRPDSEFMKGLRENVSLREENLAKARRRYERRKELYEKGVVPREVFEEAERLFRVATIEYEMAKLRLKDTLLELKRELASLKKERDSLRRELERYRIRSPVDGVVLKRFVEVGDYVNPVSRDNVLFSIGSEKRKVELDVDEELAPLVRKGQEVYITTDAVPGRVFRGRVKGIDLESEPTRRVVEVDVEVDLPRSVPVNSVVEGNIVVSRLKTTVVPIEAIKNGFAVLVVNGERKKVRVNRLFESYGEVLGYPPGTPCVIEE